MPSGARKTGSSHLRQLSRVSLERPLEPQPRSPDTVSSTSTLRGDRPPSSKAYRIERDRRYTVTVNESFDRDGVLLNLDLIAGDVKPGSLMAIDVVRAETDKPTANSQKQQHHDRSKDANSSGPVGAKPGDAERRYIFMVKDMPKDLKARYPSVEVYVPKSIADAFGMKRGSQVLLTPIDAQHPAIEASHVELAFKEQYLSRADMWRMTVAELSDRTVYKGQMLLFLGAVKAQVTAVFVDGRKVQSAFFGRNTKPIFRSESARYVLFIQMSREMWDFDSDGSGEILFNKVVHGFLPTLFKKWSALNVRHIVTIVLFSRVEYDTGISTEFASAAPNDYYTGVQTSGDRRPYKDFYRVVVTEMSSYEWTKILYQLKRELNFFRRDISLHHLQTRGLSQPLDGNPEKEVPLSRVKAEPSRAMYGNFLEAINMATALFSRDYIDRDLTRTGISVVVISPSPGVFEVDYDSLRRTTEALVGNGIGIDLICVPKVPLHSVPLFRYRNPQYLPRSHNKGKLVLSLASTPKQASTAFGSYNSISSSFSPSKGLDGIAVRGDSGSSTHSRDEWCFALPTWLHVSYWTGTSEETLSYQGIALNVAETSQQQSSEEFMIRCRMYDLQMRSVMETNEIETVPLHTDPYFPRRALQPDPYARPQLDQNGNIAIRNLKVPDLLFDHVFGFQKFATDRNPKPGEKSLWKLLQEYDESRARLPSSRRTTLYPRHHRDLEEPSRRNILEDTGLLGTSYTERRPSTIGSHMLPVGSMTSQRSIPDKMEPSSSVSSKVSSPTKPPKFMRHISLSTRGFGIAASKAAIAEVSIETANASRNMTPSRNVSDPSTMTPKRKPSSSTLSPMPISASSLASPNGRVDPSYSHESRLAETPSRPIVIRGGLVVPEPTSQFTAGSILASTLRPDIGFERDIRYSNAIRADDAKKVYNSKLLAGVLPELPLTLSPTSALSPWLTVVNPSNPDTNKIDTTSLYSRWQHVFPNPSEMRLMKWKTFCCPAAVPLTTEYFPTKAQLDSEYQRQPYNVSRDVDDELTEEPKSRDELMREMISLRFSQGFQAVVGPAVARAFGQRQLKIADIFSRDHMADDGTSIFMSLGNTIHQLSCVNGNEVEVNIFVRKPPETQFEDGNHIYKPAIRTLLDSDYRTHRLEDESSRVDRNWNYVDSFVAGHHDELTENLRFWRARYVLIPLSPRHPSLPRTQAGDSEEEVRIEGIRKLAQLWLKHRYIPPGERQRYQGSEARKKKDPNPLDIVYKTEDPSVVIAAELETLPLLESLEGPYRKGQLVTSRDRFQKKNFSHAALAEAMQQPVENGGIRMQNRRWHLRLHYNCFIGSDMTSWLLDNFEDLEDREEAEALGKRLMVSDDDRSKDKEKDPAKEGKRDGIGLFVHVERRHPFRDGQYFYQFSSEYAKPHPPSWFNTRRKDMSVPSTPLTETMPREVPRAGLSRPTSFHEENSPNSGATTPTVPTVNAKKPKVVLSKVMKYDVDHRKRSYRPEVVDLHYDRLHNPDNCYHIRVDWMNVTAKLVEDAVESWAREALAYGLRLVELPIAEACTISDMNPFRRPYLLKLKVPPPAQQPATYYDPNSFGPQAAPGKFFYQRAILRKFDFVLDTEAASNFPSDVEVSYSWGKPNFRYTQYIHRTGVLIAEITDDGGFLFLANLVYSNRAAAAREKEIQKETRSSEQATKDRDRVGASSRMAAPAAAGSYTPYGIAEPTPISSPTIRPTLFSSPVVRPVLAGRTQAPLAISEFGAASPAQPNPIAGGLTPGPATPGPLTPGYDLVRDDVVAFCQDANALEAFYKELLERGVQRPPNPTPLFMAQTQLPAAVPEQSIPTLGLPPGVLAAAASDTSGSPRVGSPAMMMSASQLLRRGSVQDVLLGARVGTGGSGSSGPDTDRDRDRDTGGGLT
ncbi:vacuolar membrane-associated protein iml-1 [Thozetella sp. PMI_491]|nr:vacuolar membrane-associated protein iml-1 [Thozetella sp. PMI_491]